jgi:hypothetical protein
MEPLNRRAAFTPLQCAKVSQHRKLKRRERRAPDARFIRRPFRGSRTRAGTWGIFLLAALLCLAGGCQSPVHSLFAAGGADWRVQQGQALWRPGRGYPEFGGDLVLASDGGGRHLIQFDKTPIAILTAQTTSNRWLIKFPQRDLSFSGFGRGPARFSWLYLPTALDGKPLPKNLHFTREADGGWRLENSRTGETLEGFLPP